MTFLEPMGLMSIIMGFLSDPMSVLFMLGLAVPVVGIEFFFFGVAIHYVGAIIVGFLLWGQFKGVLTKVVVVILWILPLPTISLSIVLGKLLSNRIIRLVAEQAAIAALAATGVGAGAAVAAEGAVVGGAAVGAAATTATVGAVATEGVIAGGAAAAEAGAQSTLRAGQALTRTTLRAEEEIAGQRAPKSIGEKIKARVQEEIAKPDELAEKVFDKMEEISDDENESDESIVDLSEGRSREDSDDSEDNSYRIAA